MTSYNTSKLAADFAALAERDNTKTLPRLLTARKVSEMTGLSVGRINWLAREGYENCPIFGSSVWIGCRRFFDADKLREGLAKRTGRWPDWCDL